LLKREIIMSEGTERSWKQLIKEHPGTTLAIGAVAAALGGAEWAVGALLGLGAGLLLTRKTGAEMRKIVRQRLRELTRLQGSETPAPAK
jgi:hypothetical protein